MSGPRDSGNPIKPNQISFLTQNLFICMVALDMDPRVKNIYYYVCDITKFHIFANDWIHESITACPSSCTSLTPNLGWECLSLMQSWDMDVPSCNHILVFFQISHVKSAHSSHQQSPCVMVSTQPIARIKLLSFHHTPLVSHIHSVGILSTFLW